jgi:hypothetical protein
MSGKANSETGHFPRMRSTRPKTALKNELVKLGIPPSQASNAINTLWKEWGKQEMERLRRCGPEHCVFAETICGQKIPFSTSRTFTDRLRPPCGPGGIMGALRSPIRHQLDRSGNEGHRGPPQGNVQASTSGALQRIKRPALNHVRFIRLKNFPDGL